MTTATRKPRSKPARRVRISILGGIGLMTLTVGKRVGQYFVTRLASDFGRAYQVESFDTEAVRTYHVCLHGSESTCECLGFCRHGHCKHLDALQALEAAGKAETL